MLHYSSQKLKCEGWDNLFACVYGYVFIRKETEFNQINLIYVGNTLGKKNFFPRVFFISCFNDKFYLTITMIRVNITKINVTVIIANKILIIKAVF